MEQDKTIICKACARLNLRRSDFERPPFEPEGKYCSVVLTDTLGNLWPEQPHCSLCRLFWRAIQKTNRQIQISWDKQIRTQNGNCYGCNPVTNMTLSVRPLNIC